MHLNTKKLLDLIEDVLGLDGAADVTHVSTLHGLAVLFTETYSQPDHIAVFLHWDPPATDYVPTAENSLARFMQDQLDISSPTPTPHQTRQHTPLQTRQNLRTKLLRSARRTTL